MSAQYWTLNYISIMQAIYHWIIVTNHQYLKFNQSSALRITTQCLHEFRINIHDNNKQIVLYLNNEIYTLSNTQLRKYNFRNFQDHHTSTFKSAPVNQYL